MAKHSSNPLDLQKPASYYANAREDVLAIVAKQGLTAKKVVELGCAGGVSDGRTRCLDARGLPAPWRPLAHPHLDER